MTHRHLVATASLRAAGLPRPTLPSRVDLAIASAVFDVSLPRATREA